MSASRRKTLFFTFIYKVFNSIIVFISSAVVSRYLSVADRGEFQLTGTYQQMGMTTFGGFMNYYAFSIRKRPDDVTEVIQTGNFLVYTASIILWLVAIALYFLPVPYIHLSRVWFFALIAMPFTFINGFGTRILNVLDEQSWLNRMNMAQPVLFMVFFIPLWLDKSMPERARLMWTYNLWIVSFLISVGATMFLTYRLLRRHGVLKWRVSWKELKGTLDYGGWSSMSQSTNYIALRMGYWYLQWVDKDLLSIYGIAVVAAEVLNTLSGSISQLVFARMTASSRNDAIAITQSSTRQTLISSSIAALGMYIVFPGLLILAYGHRYLGSIVPFLILLPAYVLRAGGAIVMQYATNSIGKPAVSVLMNLVYIVVNGIFIAVFWPFFNPMFAVSVATTLSALAFFVTYARWFRRSAGVPASTLWKVTRADFRPYFEVLSAIQQKVRRTGR